MLSKIEEAYKNRDLEALDALAIPTFREVNKKNNFKSVLMLSKCRYC
jgi:citrate lyase subunit beta/citryl-CoA lyase